MQDCINKVTLLGWLGQNPTFQRMESGRGLAVFDIATSLAWRDKATGEQIKKTEWHRVVVFKDDAVITATRDFTKGSRVEVHGELRSKTRTDKKGVLHKETHIVVERTGHYVKLAATRRAPRESEWSEDQRVSA